jgi:hypothetical protein
MIQTDIEKVKGALSEMQTLFKCVLMRFVVQSFYCVTFIPTQDVLSESKTEDCSLP